jgi:hypothetical protein
MLKWLPVIVLEPWEDMYSKHTTENCILENPCRCIWQWGRPPEKQSHNISIKETKNMYDASTRIENAQTNFTVSIFRKITMLSTRAQCRKANSMPLIVPCVPPGEEYPFQATCILCKTERTMTSSMEGCIEEASMLCTGCHKNALQQMDIQRICPHPSCRRMNNLLINFHGVVVKAFCCHCKETLTIVC